ncbi:hypothetical protein [Kitasatospora sp. DSM 101779]|uniref:hypothetical protein n=1 Tax=Kitasatospora sp. DSM 101779 TaxID=2853165 RepID=UPI0021DAFAED|nr:hypothetical protein [Kitasatospora sp. DSM 101779]MCU7820650.1 hypothetical protein [Kitasatospora sp. DSM 101779]
MHTTTRPATARLLVVWAVLVGLFLMHGAPVAAGGCHDDMTRAVAAPGMAAPPHAHTAVGAADDDRVPSAAPSEARAHGGAACLSTPAHGRITLAAPSLLAVLSLALLASTCALRHPTGSAGLRRRGPPAAGRPLLHQVCVSRT